MIIRTRRANIVHRALELYTEDRRKKGGRNSEILNQKQTQIDDGRCEKWAFCSNYLDLPTRLADPDRWLRLPINIGGLECI